MTTIHHSPLRYPGGKGGLAGFLAQVICLNGIEGGIYAEPYAGGAGAALSLLANEYISQILINDADPNIYAFWASVTNRTDDFIELIDRTPLTMDEWERQRNIYRSRRASQIARGFATFYLNRCNRSGIIQNGGPIGGMRQDGKWRIDARFNRAGLKARVRQIADFGERISVSNHDAIDFLQERIGPLSKRKRLFVYLDPPYYAKGPKLYLNAYTHDDHVALARYIVKQSSYRWLISYDDVPQIRAIYAQNRKVNLELSYSAYTRRSGRELVLCQDDLRLPSEIKISRSKCA